MTGRVGNSIPLSTSLALQQEESPIPFRFRSSSYRIHTLFPSEQRYSASKEPGQSTQDPSGNRHRSKLPSPNTAAWVPGMRRAIPRLCSAEPTSTSPGL